MLVLLFTTSCLLYQCVVLGDGITLNGYEVLPVGTLIDGLLANEISGIAYNSMDGMYYGISDDLIENKGFYGFDFEVDSNTGSVSYSVGDGIQMERSNELPLISMDTECIAFIKNPNNKNNSYYIVGQEGHKTYNTKNELYLYSSSDGKYIRTITDELNVKFLINNTENNRGIEGVAVDETQTYLVYATEKALLSDRSLCTNCIRISVNNFIVNEDGDDNISLDELYELRYDLDSVDTTKYPNIDAFIGLTDIAIFKNKNDKLYGLILERLSTENTYPAQLYDNKIYLVDLTDKYRDTKQCYSLSDDKCKNIEAIEKTLLFTFSSDTGNGTLAQMTPYGNIEVLTILYDGDTFYNDENIINLIAINDNDGAAHTTFVYLKYDAINTLNDNTIYTTMPETTKDADLAIKININIQSIFIFVFTWFII